jgi:hypothetical protein
VLACRIGDDHIDGVIIVKLVDFILSFDHRHLPAEQVDEEALAIGEHGSEQRLVGRF